MSIGHCNTPGVGSVPPVLVPAAAQQPLQRLAQVRQRQGISRRTMARRLNLDIEEVRRLESESADVPVSVLYAWHQALEVPVVELLVEASDALASPVLKRSQLVRLMKTVLAIGDQAKQESIRRMAQTMIGQLTEIMPELANVGPWHVVGQRRRLNELGVAAQRRLPDSVFIDPND